MENVKITKRTILTAIAEYVAAHEDFEVTVDDVTVTAEDVDAYVTTTIEQIDKKNEAAKVRNAKKKAEGDALRTAIANVLTDEFQTIAQIADQLDVEDVTPAKISARLTQLVKAGEAHKTDVKVDGRKVKGYAVGPAPVDAE
jgi:hypothetical protein